MANRLRKSETPAMPLRTTGVRSRTQLLAILLHQPPPFPQQDDNSEEDATSRQLAYDVGCVSCRRPCRKHHIRARHRSSGRCGARPARAFAVRVTPSRTYSGASTGAGPSTMRLIAVAVNGLPAFVRRPALESIPEMSRNDRRSPVFGLARRSRFASATASG